jgi:hypothetical protein
MWERLAVENYRNAVTQMHLPYTPEEKSRVVTQCRLADRQGITGGTCSPMFHTFLCYVRKETHPVSSDVKCNWRTAFWDVATYGFILSRRFGGTCRLHFQSRGYKSSEEFLLPWRWRRQVPPKRRFIINPHCVTSQKSPFFIVTAVRTSNQLQLYNFRSGDATAPKRQASIQVLVFIG